MGVFWDVPANERTLLNSNTSFSAVLDLCISMGLKPELYTKPNQPSKHSSMLQRCLFPNISVKLNPGR